MGELLSIAGFGCQPFYKNQRQSVHDVQCFRAAIQYFQLSVLATGFLPVRAIYDYRRRFRHSFYGDFWSHFLWLGLSADDLPGNGFSKN